MNRIALPVTLVTFSLLVACGPKPETMSTTTPQNVTTVAATAERDEAVTLEDGRTITVHHGASKDPAVAGCADGTREAFYDENTFPRIAGCLATWSNPMSMRSDATGHGCGDGLGPCSAPADACAAGWHPCGLDGSVAELRQVQPAQCEQAGAGRFSAAISHCLTQDTSCQYDASEGAHYQCFDDGWCSEPVCCGADCGEFGACTGGVWTDHTHIEVGQDQGCGRVAGLRAGGVLCCR